MQFTTTPLEPDRLEPRDINQLKNMYQNMTKPRRTIMWKVVLCLLAVCGDINANPEIEKGRDPPPKHYNIVLIGATGDLAEKYLWRGLFELFSQHHKSDQTQFTIYGCARKVPNEGRTAMSNILLNVIKCGNDKCRENKRKFVEASQYHQLKKESHYKALGEKIAENTQSMYALLGTKFSHEAGRLVYLSIPPSQYAKTAKYVHQYLRPRLGRNPWMRLVLEKPFGHDIDSATQLAKDIGEFFNEQETYRADHYLGKTVVKQILPFRYVNAKTYGELWSRHHIERVDVVMKEKVDVQGRTSFYDEVGIIRDVMQNHLMELLALIAMEMPDDSGNINALLESKLNLLKQVQLDQSGCLLGQYSTYNSEWLNELEYVHNVSYTPTFGACLLTINNARWRDVPFTLMSGKKMDEKASYVRISFKNNQFCTSKADLTCNKKSQIVFYIGGSNLHVPGMVTVTDNLPKPKATSGWALEHLKLDLSLFGESINDTHQMVAQVDDDAYTNLIQAVHDGNRQMFIDEASLLMSWKIWTPVIEYSKGKLPRIYQGVDVDPESLNFHIKNNGLQFDLAQDVFHVDDPSSPSLTTMQIPASFLGNPLVAAPRNELIEKLAKEIYNVAMSSITARGRFDLALPGGLSPVSLFQKLASPTMTAFPWDQTHIWQVDERCVALSDQDSNFNSHYNHLMSHVPIPYWNMHPMPVDLSTEMCSNADNGPTLYTDKLKSQLVNMSMDYTLLGLGADGHIASLFPHQPFVESNNSFVMFSSAPSGKPSPRRMTMTLDLINRSHNIGILANGRWKQEIIAELSKGEASQLAGYPVTHVKSSVGSTVWFIDYDAIIHTSHL